MNDVLLVRRLHRPRQRLHQRRRFLRRQRRAVELLLQAAAAAELQREERLALVLADLVDLHDVGMLQARDGLRLGLEAGQVRRAGVAARQDHLQRHQPIQLRLPRLVDHAHAAAAQLAEDLVARRRSWPPVRARYRAGRG